MKLLLIILSFFVFTTNAFSAPQDITEDEGLVAVKPTASRGDETNQLASSICQFILILNGRIGRAIAVIAVLIIAFIFMSKDKLSVPVLVSIIIGITLLFGAKSIALVLLPSYVTVKDSDQMKAGNSGKVKKTPDELIRQYCPELV